MQIWLQLGLDTIQAAVALEMIKKINNITNKRIKCILF